ncbi:hypothetical protein HAX54_042041 [Datura stramonium]|uniref:Uncharacterized protein n=1 Tax=Datura stramonium TaxID=4076 RepID=A0ABS8VYC3_DATST|nr:hypothetical protein [Datura stramonium]
MRDLSREKNSLQKDLPSSNAIKKPKCNGSGSLLTTSSGKLLQLDIEAAKVEDHAQVETLVDVTYESVVRNSQKLIKRIIEENIKKYMDIIKQAVLNDPSMNDIQDIVRSLPDNGATINVIPFGFISNSG